MNTKHIGPVLALGCVVLAANTAAGQHRWKPSVKASGRSEAVRPITIRPMAAISGGANRVYCPDMADGAVGVHDLGWIPSGLNVAVTVESFSDAPFDPVAAVVVATVGENAGNTQVNIG